MAERTADGGQPPRPAGVLGAGFSWTLVGPYATMLLADLGAVVADVDRSSRTPACYRLPAPELDEHGDDPRAWLTAPREDVDA
jgi:crotonobetainyl-CoA:carnitine CoA-transferase CaiB-like acyl-CoA transferase